MKRIPAIVGAGLLLFGVVGGVAANSPIKVTERTRDASCSGVVTPLGTANFQGFLSDLNGADAWLDVWSGEPYTGDPTLTRDWELPATVTFGAGTVAMTIPLLPAGEATVSGTLTPADTISQDDRFRDGNSWYRSAAHGTAFAFSGELTLPGLGSPVAFGPDGCGGSDIVTDTFVTQPHAAVASFTSSGGVCDLVNAAGDTATLFLGIDEGTVFVDGNASDAGGSQVDFSGAAPAGADGTASIITDEFDPETGASLGTGSATITLADTGETFEFTLHASNGFVRTRGSLIDVGGQLVTSIGTFSLEACIATNRDIKRVTTPSSGPKPGGKRPPNDLPSGAIALKPGARVTVATKGAQLPSEAAYPCLDFTDPFDGTTFTVPVEYTVWYRITGTGSLVTVDTAGSDFDTVVAVYAGSPNANATVACVDDTQLQPFGRTLQASATFPTLAGTTYWVQAGGLDEEVFGPDPFVPYGTLKVAVR